MTQLQFSVNFDDLKDKILTSDLSDVVKSTIVILMNQYMEQEREEYIRASAHERSEERRDYRNGYYERDYVLQLGKVTLRVPRTRKGEFHTELFKKYQRNEQALLACMLEMVVTGVSTRKVTKAIEQLCGKSVSKSFVSNLTEQLDPVIKEWNSRRLVMYYPYVYADATYIKVREDHRIVSKAVYIAMGVNYKGKRDILGIHIGNQESTTEWATFFNTLKARGLKTPEMVISDAHEGLKSSITTCLTGAAWQRCTVHFLRNVISKMPKKGSEEPRAIVKSIFKADGLEEAKARLKVFCDRYENEKKYKGAVECLNAGFDEACQFYTVEQASIRTRIKSTNVLERMNSEIKRRTRVIRIFPNADSAFRLIGAVLMDVEETLDPGGRNYMNFSSIN